MKISEVTKYPVLVMLNKKNPWGKSVKVNNILISVDQQIKIDSVESLNSLTPVEKYIIIEESKEVSIPEVQEEVKAKKTRKKKTDI